MWKQISHALKYSGKKNYACHVFDLFVPAADSPEFESLIIYHIYFLTHHENHMLKIKNKCSLSNSQIRKTHFPPRPQFRKTRNSATPNHSSLTTRSNLGSASPSTYGSSSPSTNGSSSSSSDDEKDQHRQQRRRPPRRVHQEAGSVVRSTNSGSSSLGIATDPDNCASPPSKRHYDGKLTNTNNHPIVTVRRKGIVNTIGRNVAKPVAAHSAGESSVASEDIEPASVLEVVTTPQSSTSSGSIPSTVNIKLQNKFFKNVIDTMPQGKIKPPTQLTIPARSLLDSGHGSCSSSLELSPDMPTCSQETFCSDIEDTIGGETVDAQTTSAVQSSYSQCSTLSLASSYETIGLTADIRSLSSSSERLPDSFDINVAEVQSRQTAVKAKRRPYSDVDAANSDDETSKPLRKMKHIENRNLSSNDQKLPLGALAMASLSSPSALGGHSIELGSEDSTYGSCMMCLTQPKNGVFVHNRFLHLCCCYRCAVKVWNKRKRCPICNCKVKNVMKLFVH